MRLGVSDFLRQAGLSPPARQPHLRAQLDMAATGARAKRSPRSISSEWRQLQEIAGAQRAIRAPGGRRSFAPPTAALIIENALRGRFPRSSDVRVRSRAVGWKPTGR